MPEVTNALSVSRKMIKSRKATWPPLTFGQVIMMDALFGIGLLAILFGVALSAYESAIAKARLSEMFSNFAYYRFELQEQLALTGDGFPRLQAEAVHSAGAASGGDQGKVLVERHSRKLDYSVTQIENSLIAKVFLGDTATPYFISYTPSVIASGVPGSMMWLCGNRNPPPGWVRLSGPTGTDFPAEYIYSICRDN